MKCLYDDASWCCKKTTVRRMCFTSFIRVFITWNNLIILDMDGSSEHIWACPVHGAVPDRVGLGQPNSGPKGGWGLIDFLSVNAALVLMVMLLLVLMVPGTLHWGALSWQLVPWHEPPLQFAPCDQLCEGPCPWDSPWGEERDSSQHQHRSLFLWPGKNKQPSWARTKKRTLLSLLMSCIAGDLKLITAKFIHMSELLSCSSFQCLWFQPEHRACC